MIDKAILALTLEYIALGDWDNTVRFLEASIDQIPEGHRGKVQVATVKVREAIRLLKPVVEALSAEAGDSSRATVLKLIEGKKKKDEQDSNRD